MNRRNSMIAATAVVGGAVMLSFAAGASDDQDEGRKLSVQEVACDMLNDGETPQFTYDVLVDLMKQHDYTFNDPERQARIVVQQAQAQRCGS